MVAPVAACTIGNCASKELRSSETPPTASISASAAQPSRKNSLGRDEALCLSWRGDRMSRSSFWIFRFVILLIHVKIPPYSKTDRSLLSLRKKRFTTLTRLFYQTYVSKSMPIELLPGKSILVQDPENGKWVKKTIKHDFRDSLLGLSSGFEKFNKMDSSFTKNF